MAVQQVPTVVRRRDRQREETRHDLAFAAIELARAKGLANVRVPEIAAAAGVSTRTFNNYFSSKEAAIAWPVARRGARLADNLLARPEGESLGPALVDAVCEFYDTSMRGEFPGPWLRQFRSLLADEPALYAEYLRAADVGEQALARAIAIRTSAAQEELRPKVLAAIVAATERAAFRHWAALAQKPGPLVETIRAALQQALMEVQA